MTEWWKPFFNRSRRDPNMKKNQTNPESNAVAAEPEKDAAKATKKKAEAATAPSTVPTKTEAVASEPAVKAKAKTKAITKTPDQPVSASTVTETPKKKPAKPKAATKAPVANAASSAQAKDIAMQDRVGLTAGTIWHYLADNGPAPVDKLIKSLSEESTIIQRGIGWLAQENKISLALVDGKETIALTE